MDRKIYTVSALTWIIPFAFALLTAFTAFFALAIAPQIPNMESPFIMILAIFGIISLLFFTLYGTLVFFDFVDAQYTQHMLNGQRPNHHAAQPFPRE